MANPFPFTFLQDLLRNPALPVPPVWMIEEVQRRCVLLINHVLMQEPQAMQRLARQKGRVILVQWRSLRFLVQTTPAGLLDLAAPEAPDDLRLVLSEESPWRLAQCVLQGDKPPVRIEGDVQLAAEVNWVADNVRWDMEEDLARIIGDTPAHLVGQACGSALAAVRSFVRARVPASGGPGVVQAASGGSVA